ncbi:MAG: Gfo/Idh/MocA family oxidoreductase [Planctomycetaceae bacterium]
MTSTSASQKITRRNFHRQTAVLSMAGVGASTLAAAERTPSEQITVGVIGLGSRGFNLIDDFLGLPDCRIVAVCDVDDFHYRDREWGKGPAFGRRPAEQRISKAYADQKSGTPQRGLLVYKDYRELIARDDIDAVVIATPDHWHALCTLEALQAGKDVYCEKPITHLFAEGQTIVAAVAKHKAVFQTGSQQRSDPRFHRVVELAQNGLLGDIHTVEVGLPPGYAMPMGSTDVVDARPDLNYDLWCGPSPKLPLMQARHHRWWRGHRAYGGGVLMDWIGHHNDIAQWAIGQHQTGPTLVEAVEWTLPKTDVYNTPMDYTIRCEYAGGITSTISSRNTLGLKLIGSEGWVWAQRGKSDASDKRWLATDFQPGSKTISAPASHAADFLARIRDRGECIAPARIAHRSITPGHLGYVSAELRQPLQWDPQTECVVGNEAADRLLKAVHYRMPWQAPESA